MIEQAKEIARLLRSNGEDCICCARYDGECGCNVAWGSNYTKEAASTIDALVAEVERLSNHIHICGPNCTKAGCMNKRLMEEVERLNSRCGILKSLRDGQIEHVAAAFAERDKALAEVESLRKDAERYRWMKQEVKRIPPGWEMVGWDAAVDAAMQGVKE